MGGCRPLEVPLASMGISCRGVAHCTGPSWNRIGPQPRLGPRPVILLITSTCLTKTLNRPAETLDPVLKVLALLIVHQLIAVAIEALAQNRALDLVRHCITQYSRPEERAQPLPDEARGCGRYDAGHDIRDRAGCTPSAVPYNLLACGCTQRSSQRADKGPLGFPKLPLQVPEQPLGSVLPPESHVLWIGQEIIGSAHQLTGCPVDRDTPSASLALSSEA